MLLISSRGIYDYAELLVPLVILTEVNIFYMSKWEYGLERRRIGPWVHDLSHYNDMATWTPTKIFSGQCIFWTCYLIVFHLYTLMLLVEDMMTLSPDDRQ